MRLCMFSPAGRELERGWPGRIEGDVVHQLAAQTLQSYFTGGGGARLHATYPLDEVVLRAPVLHPPSIRIFAADGDFHFANPAAVRGPGDTIALPAGVDSVESHLRLAAVIGDGGAIGGFTLLNEWHAPQLPGAKSRDFAISLGPTVVTPDELETAGDWEPLLDHVGRNTLLLPGDVIAAGGELLGPFRPGDLVEAGFEPIGILRNGVA
ncbi:MAG TPA: fumarylacetoacetate hydrolase family protein [Gaiellaceae bacterium]|nr:fumarylacetoacetate hydrolase family protein [Gaiellaceae bacterium]